MKDICFIPFPVLETLRLTLRQVNSNDAPELFALRTNNSVMQFLDRPKAASLEEIQVFIQRLEEGLQRNEDITWAITLKQDPRLIGTICYWHIQKEHFRAEIGYMLHPGFQGRGLMQEALTTVLDYGFSTMGLHSVEANVNPDNTASIRLLERNNFVREAYFKENYYYNGAFLDSAVYSLIKPQ